MIVWESSDRGELMDKKPVLTVVMASGGRFSITLEPERAPLACASVLRLARQGAYDGLAVERIVPGFVIQPRCSDEGRPDLDFMIDGEFAANGFAGGLTFEPGVVGMAGDGARRASGSQFFIALGGCERLNGRFTAIGRVTDGWEEILRLERVPTKPVETGLPHVIVNRPLAPEILVRVTAEEA